MLQAPSHAAISPEELVELVGTAAAPLLIDVRRRPVFEAAKRMIAGARWREHTAVTNWLPELAPRQAAVPPDQGPLARGVARDVVIYCVHGHQVSLAPCARLRVMGIPARYLSGGFEGYLAAGGTTMARLAQVTTSLWVIDAGPTAADLGAAWLIRRFVDPAAEIAFAPREWAREAAAELGAEYLATAVPPASPDAREREMRAGAGLTSLVTRFGLQDAALTRVVEVLQDLQTRRADGPPEAAGVAAVVSGLAAPHGDDQATLAAALPVFDALYLWARRCVRALAAEPILSAASGTVASR